MINKSVDFHIRKQQMYEMNDTLCFTNAFKVQEPIKSQNSNWKTSDSIQITI